VVKLSDAVQQLPRSVTEFVHGVPESFLAVGAAKAAPPPEGQRRFSKGAYFIGKAIWAKGYTELLDLVERDARAQPDHPHIDCYGYGDDLDEVRFLCLRCRVVIALLVACAN
jgi:digalactosyldiacylglycerol synthase